MRLVVALAVASLYALAACGDDPRPDPCIAMQCALPAAPRCDGNTLIVAQDATCTAVGGAAQCDYPETRTDCAASGMMCAAGACHPPGDPCIGTTCSTPPAASCAQDVATTYDAAGTCDGSSGAAVCSYAPHTTDCTLTKQVCQGGACVDPCTGVTCTAPPADSCTDGTLHDYPATGTCDGSTGTAMCVYTATDIDCTDDDQICTGGACVDPCAVNPCTAPPADTCTDDTANQHTVPGTCTSPGGVVACDYAVTPVDCNAIDKICDAGACTDPCVGFACMSPPAAACSNNTLTTYASTGTCASPGGVPACTYAPTSTDCTATDDVCQGGACVDPCVGVTCNAPLAPACVGAGNSTARTFAASGTCASPGGVVECDYAPTDQDCSLSGQTCASGACTGPALFCRVQFPDAITDVPTTTQTVFGRVFVQGVTDQSGGNDPNANVVVQLGLGTGADPTTWTWTAATPNASYGPGSPGYEANNDEYQGTFLVPSAAGTTQRYGYRLSNDGGTSWLYCDAGNAGSSDGFTTPGLLHIAAPYLSEYVEGTAATSRAIEIYNPGSIPFAMSSCQLQIFANGAITSNNVNITGTSIAAHDVYVICKTGYVLADAAQCDQTTGSGLWTGNDAVQLKCGAAATLVVYDILGRIGEDPGTEWGTDLTSTSDNTLVRKCDVFSGDVDGTDAFDPAPQWQGYATDASFLGGRSCPLPP